MPYQLIPLSVLLISNISYAISSITRLAFLVNLFLLFAFVKILAEAINSLITNGSSNDNLPYFVINIIVSINSSINFLKVMVYKSIISSITYVPVARPLVDSTMVAQTRLIQDNRLIIYLLSTNLDREFPHTHKLTLMKLH